MDREILNGCQYNASRDNQHAPKTYRKALFETANFGFQIGFVASSAPDEAARFGSF